MRVSFSQAAMFELGAFSNHLETSRKKVGLGIDREAPKLLGLAEPNARGNLQTFQPRESRVFLLVHLPWRLVLVT